MDYAVRQDVSTNWPVSQHPGRQLRCHLTQRRTDVPYTTSAGPTFQKLEMTSRDEKIDSSGHFRSVTTIRWCLRCSLFIVAQVFWWTAIEWVFLFRTRDRRYLCAVKMISVNLSILVFRRFYSLRRSRHLTGSERSVENTKREHNIFVLIARRRRLQRCCVWRSEKTIVKSRMAVTQIRSNSVENYPKYGSDSHGHYIVFVKVHVFNAFAF